MNKTSGENSNRIAYFDVAKGIAIVLVVLGHIISVHSNPLQVWIYSFHIPAFFMISGMIYALKSDFQKTTIQQFTSGRITQLLYPYITFGLLFLGRYVLQIYIGSGDSKELAIHILNFISLMGIGVLWFLPTLLISEIFFKMIMKQNEQIKYISFIILVIITLFISKIYRPVINWDIEFVGYSNYVILFSRAIVGTVFLMIGYKLVKVFELSTKKSDFVLATMLLFSSIILSQLNGDVDLNKYILGNPIVYYIAAISGTGALIYISKLIIHNEALIFFGKNSLLIMVTHSIFGIYKFSYIIISRVLNLSNYFYVEIIVVLLFTLILETLVILLINKYFWFLLNKPILTRRHLLWRK